MVEKINFLNNIVYYLFIYLYLARIAGKEKLYSLRVTKDQGRLRAKSVRVVCTCVLV